MNGPQSAECLRRARERVMNILVVASLGIAVSGLILRNTAAGALPIRADRARQLAQLLLFVLVIASVRLRGRLPNRGEESSLSKANRFVAFRTASAVSAGLAVPLGLVYGWAINPDLWTIAPFWAVAIGFGVLAFPRSPQVESLGLDGPDA